MDMFPLPGAFVRQGCAAWVFETLPPSASRPRCPVLPTPAQHSYPPALVPPSAQHAQAEHNRTRVQQQGALQLKPDPPPHTPVSDIHPSRRLATWCCASNKQPEKLAIAFFAPPRSEQRPRVHPADNTIAQRRSSYRRPPFRDDHARPSHRTVANPLVFGDFWRADDRASASLLSSANAQLAGLRLSCPFVSPTTTTSPGASAQRQSVPPTTIVLCHSTSPAAHPALAAVTLAFRPR